MRSYFQKSSLKMAQCLEEINRKISTQFKLLDFAEKETERLLTRNKKSEIEKHIQHVKFKLEKLQELKYSTHEVLLEESEMGNLEEWSGVMEEKMVHFDDAVSRLKIAISNVEKKEEAKALHEENINQEEMFRRRMEEELKIQEMKLQIKSKVYEKRDKIVNEERVNDLNVKLPKLVIIKFDGTSLDWLGFWNQFKSEIGKADIDPVSKFFYLKELLIPRVRLLIDGLPFTYEGYSRAKSILRGEFGKSTVTAATHIQCITSLPFI